MLVVHHRRPIALPAVAVIAAGDTLPGGIIRWRRVSGDTVALADTGTVHCTRRSETVVAAEAGAVSRQFVVRCRPLKGFVFGAEVLLRPGSAPQPFPIYAIGTDDEPITDLAAEAAEVDTAVAELVGGNRVRAKRTGGTVLKDRAGSDSGTLVIKRAAWGPQSAASRTPRPSPVRGADADDGACPALLGWAPKGRMAAR